MAWNAYKLIMAPTCRYCGNKDGVYKYGRGKTGQQRYRCRSCGRTFQTKYIYSAYRPELQQETFPQ